MLSSQKCTSLTLEAEIMGKKNRVWISEGWIREAQKLMFLNQSYSEPAYLSPS